MKRPSLSWVSTPNRDKNLHRGLAGAAALGEEQSNKWRDCLIRNSLNGFNFDATRFCWLYRKVQHCQLAEVSVLQVSLHLQYQFPCSFWRTSSLLCFLGRGNLQILWGLICSEILTIKKSVWFNWVNPTNRHGACTTRGLPLIICLHQTNFQCATLQTPSYTV